jgi:hypothetical protein
MTTIRDEDIISDINVRVGYTMEFIDNAIFEITDIGTNILRTCKYEDFFNIPENKAIKLEIENSFKAVEQGLILAMISLNRLYDLTKTEEE